MFQFAIDRGGTFTDVWARCPNGKIRVLKLLSEDPANYPDAPREGIRRILEEETGEPHPRTSKIKTERIEWIRMGTTLATNALLERKGTPMALAITRGFRDLLHIGNQSRSNLFDLSCRMPSLLYDEVIEVDERVMLHQSECQLAEKLGRLVNSEATGEPMHVAVELNEAKLREDLKAVRQRGITSLAVLLIHSYLYDAHERRVGEIARELGFQQVSLSSHVMRMQRAVPRGFTACADAYLTPCIASYVRRFLDGFETPANGKRLAVQFMQSDGGLADAESFLGSRAILSGPAGGVVGYATVTRRYTDSPIIGFDMGGTSTDVSRFAGSYEHVFETTLAGITIQSPQLDVNTVAAGGGSILTFRAGLFRVGPESAGAHPGPACYRKHGPLTVTDANLQLGRLVPSCFPAIFGEHENEPLDNDVTRNLFESLTNEINQFKRTEAEQNGVIHRELSVEEVAMGFIRVANESMCRPIRALTQARGFDTSRHALAVFGGAGAQHACAIARTLGVQTVFVHRFAGALSAVGIALADCVVELQTPAALQLTPQNETQLLQMADRLATDARQRLRLQGFQDSRIDTETFFNMRYDGTDTSIMISELHDSAVLVELHGTASASAVRQKHSNFEQAFLARYRVEYGFNLLDCSIHVDDVRVRAVGRSAADCILQDRVHVRESSSPLVPRCVTRCFFDGFGWLDTPVFDMSSLQANDSLPGPTIIVDSTNTILIEPDSVATLTEFGDLRIDVARRAVDTEKESEAENTPDAIYLSIFSHRFMSIAEQAGRVLQRTAISTNIKERLDFSCALFGPDGCLVANAPHIPVHLGAMQEAVQYQIRVRGESLRDGDVLLSNHPQAGGSHLPDLTVITPCFFPGQQAPVFFVASRGHHADIGGLTPGSMPPHSRTIDEEGAVFTSFLLVRDGQLQETALRDVLVTAGTRRLQDNLSDLRAQVAANQKAITLLKELIVEYSLPVVQRYMKHIQQNAELAVREMLRDVAARLRARYAENSILKAELEGDCGLVQDDGRTITVRARDKMDDGAEIALRLSIDSSDGSAEFDFHGTSSEVYGNLNAPRAVTFSAIIYCLRCIVGYDVPLNQGCLAPIRIRIPHGSMLDPPKEAAVVGGNVLTSQRLVDVVLRAFEVCAASQGCMNNITFGNHSFGYYETVAGGGGAGPGWHGRSGVHVHMTNTRITDVEVLERRYPVALRQFRLRASSGGRGRFQGGDGVLRELLFRQPVLLSVLTERRSHPPYGLHGGLPALTGRNLLLRHVPNPLSFAQNEQDVDADTLHARVINLGSKCSVQCIPGDLFRLETPGGGGYGEPSQHAEADQPVKLPDLALKGSLYNYKLLQESA